MDLYQRRFLSCFFLCKEIIFRLISSNSVIGWGRVRGRKVFVTADDFSVRGGHADGGIAGKAPYGEVCPTIWFAFVFESFLSALQILAAKARVPLVSATIAS